MLLTISCEFLSPNRSTSCDRETSLNLHRSFILFKTLSTDSMVAAFTMIFDFEFFWQIKQFKIHFCFPFFLGNKRRCFIHDLKTLKKNILRSIYFKLEISHRPEGLEYIILESVKYMHFVNPKFVICPHVLLFPYEIL